MTFELPQIPPLQPGQRLYVCKGSPWREALKVYRSSRRLGSVWTVPRTYRAGDLILTILETDPPVFLCIEVASEDGARATDILVDSVAEFSDGISVGAIRNAVGFTPQSRGYYEGAEAEAILDALRTELAAPSPWFLGSVGLP